MTPEQLRNQIKDSNAVNLLDRGYKGFRVIKNAFSATAGEVFHCLEVAIAADITATNGFGGDNLDGLTTYPAGTKLYGHFDATTVSVTVGTVIGQLV